MNCCQYGYPKIPTRHFSLALARVDNRLVQEQLLDVPRLRQRADRLVARAGPNAEPAAGPWSSDADLLRMETRKNGRGPDT